MHSNRQAPSHMSSSCFLLCILIALIICTASVTMQTSLLFSICSSLYSRSLSYYCFPFLKYLTALRCTLDYFPRLHSNQIPFGSFSERPSFNSPVLRSKASRVSLSLTNVCHMLLHPIWPSLTIAVSQIHSRGCRIVGFVNGGIRMSLLHLSGHDCSTLRFGVAGMTRLGGSSFGDGAGAGMTCLGYASAAGVMDVRCGVAQGYKILDLWVSPVSLSRRGGCR